LAKYLKFRAWDGRDFRVSKDFAAARREAVLLPALRTGWGFGMKQVLLKAEIYNKKCYNVRETAKEEKFEVKWNGI
jgi:hypothetical protein